MGNRREAHNKRRRVHHAVMRVTQVLRQGDSPREAPDDTPSAQKAQKSLKARKA